MRMRQPSPLLHLSVQPCCVPWGGSLRSARPAGRERGAMCHYAEAPMRGPTRGRRPAWGVRLRAKRGPVGPQPMRAFEGGRYLEPADAPPDLDLAHADLARMPPKMLAELRALGLI